MVTEEKIWEYLDGSLNEADHAEVASAINSDSNVALLYQEISALHRLLGTQTPEQPSMSFTENVMRAVMPRFQYNAARPISLWPVLVSIIPFFILLILVCAVYIYSPVASSTLGISSQVGNILKIGFILIDSVLLALFAEQWWLSKKTV
jgi:anti-sigma factor RsiW